MDQEQSASLTATRVETIHGPTYSMARVIGQYTASPELAVGFLSQFICVVRHAVNHSQLLWYVHALGSCANSKLIHKQLDRLKVQTMGSVPY